MVQQRFPHLGLEYVLQAGRGEINHLSKFRRAQRATEKIALNDGNDCLNPVIHEVGSFLCPKQFTSLMSEDAVLSLSLRDDSAE
jgi:hypothetical protein